MTVHNHTLTRPALTNTDLIDRLVDTPLADEEAAKVLAFYLPMVDGWSPAESWKNRYLQARLHIGAAIGRSLGQVTFASAVTLGAEIHARRTGAEADPTYALWSMDQLFQDLGTEIDQLLEGAA